MPSSPAVNADLTVVAASATAVTLLAADGIRAGLAIYNAGSEILYVLLDNRTPTVSATAFTVALAADDYWEVPFNYQGAVTGVWAGTPTGSAMVTAFLA